MGRIIASTNGTLDGGVGDPTGEEGAARGGWFGRVGPSDREAFGRAALAEAQAADAFLMGRRTYEFLAGRWPARTGPLADRLAEIPKFVVSGTVAEPQWRNTEVIRGEAVPTVTRLRRQIDGEIVVPASFQLVRALLAADLVDEIRVIVYPFLLGSGTPLYGQLPDEKRLHLLDQRRLGDHLLSVAYRIVGTGAADHGAGGSDDHNDHNGPKDE